MLLADEKRLFADRSGFLVVKNSVVRSSQQLAAEKSKNGICNFVPYGRVNKKIASLSNIKTASCYKVTNL